MPKKYTRVDQVLAKYIWCWPSLCDNRHDALQWVFTNSAVREWKDGCPVFWDDKWDFDNELNPAGIQKRIEKMGASDRRHAEFEELRIRRETAQCLFVRRNSKALARAVTYKPMFRGTPYFSTYYLNHIPLGELTPEWKTALIEYCKSILDVREEDVKYRQFVGGYNDLYLSRELGMLRESQAAAREGLARLAPELTPKEQADQRQTEINELRSKAERYGMKLVPREEASNG